MAENTMIEYSEFVGNLKTELNSYGKTPKEIWEKTATLYVNGLASDELRRLVKLEKRRKDGVFFTNASLADKVLELLEPGFNEHSIIYDAACGVCNLLIAADGYLNKKNIQPLSNSYLLGTDIHKEFVEAAKYRLQMNNLLKLTKASTTDIKQKQKAGYGILMANGLKNNAFYKTATHIFLNPPFNQEKVNEKLSWASGKVSMAAVFMDKAIQYANPGSTIMAILPDVLRSGTRYEKWRNIVEENCIVEKTVLLGQFDTYADVDVYAVKMIKREKPVEKIDVQIESNKPADKQTLKDLFHICVGPVVDNRDEKNGPLRPYVISRGLEGWSTQKKISLTRQHKGKSFAGPLVVIKRTSRATDNNRAIATIINTKQPVYVDNHLIILKPKAGKLTACKLAIKILKDEKTNEWLNEEIRCRHLTVKAVSGIPIYNK